MILALLVLRVDREQVLDVMGSASLPLVALAVLLNVPAIFIKSLRWRWLLRAHGIIYGTVPSFLAYFGSIFIGLLTPGRLGEFIKAVHVSRDCGIPTRRAFASVLADRLFDLYALAIVGGLALIALGSINTIVLMVGLGSLALALIAPPTLLLNGWTYGRMQTLGMRLGRIGRALFAPQGWVAELRRGLRELSPPWVLLATGMTVLAYAVFYTQAYLLALALDIDLSVIQVSYAVALGSLVTLVPVSIAGIGTREAAIVAYLGTTGVSAEAALGFAFLVFATFYVGTALIGSVAWIIKPVALEGGHRMKLSEISKVSTSQL